MDRKMSIWFWFAIWLISTHGSAALIYNLDITYALITFYAYAIIWYAIFGWYWSEV